MAGPLLQSKIHLPSRRHGVIARPRLRERLDGAAGSALTLVSAPAGFGKTTLLTEWLADADLPVAWLSLDALDNDPARYWTYVVAALRTAAEDVGAGASALLQSPQPSIEAVIATLLNDVHALPHDIVLVLDDYHVVEAAEVHDGMALLVEHLPPTLHLVIATRADPALALARMRARGELVEVRAADLRFTAGEAATYLDAMTGTPLTADDVAALHGRTEGWIAALQLAALSMRGRDDVSAFIAGFAGDDRYIVDYLAEEVLARQPAEVRDFLLRTSVLDRLSGPLCDAVTGRTGGTATLAALERGNLFLVPLDDRRSWYRYHQLFADVLQAHLAEQYPGDVRELHRRASVWHEQDGDPAAAVRHALTAGEVDRAAELVELAVPELRRTRQETTIRGWLDAIPDEVVQVRPVLALGFVGALMSCNEFASVGRRLQDIERSLDRPDMVVVDAEELNRLPAGIEMYRAALSLMSGDVPGTVAHAHTAMDLTAPDDHLVRSAASALAALALWSSGDLDAAHQGYTTSVQGLQRAGHLSDVLGCSITLADIRITQGRLDDAQRTYEEALRLNADGTVLRGTADMYVGLSQLALERNDVQAARAHLHRARELGEDNWLPQNPYRWRVAMARVREAEGDLDGALALLDEAQAVYTGDFSPDVRPVAASRARVLLAQGRLGDALAWARHLSTKDDLMYVREFEHITLARVLLAQSQDVFPFLQRLLAAAEAGGRTGNVIEILTLQSLAQNATEPLERALTLAEPQRYVRTFVGEGTPMASLLKKIAKQRPAWDYVRRLVDAGTHPVPAGTLVDPLSERELDVLRLLGSELSGPDIARRLFVSLNTLRTHTKSVYAKLGVNSRRAAVRRATELNLL